MTYTAKLQDPRWQKRRLEILTRDEYTCKICGDNTQTLHVHHYAYPHSCDPWDVPDWVLATLCERCHRVIHLKLSTLERELIDHFKTVNFENHQAIRQMNTIILKQFS